MLQSAIINRRCVDCISSLLQNCHSSRTQTGSVPKLPIDDTRGSSCLRQLRRNATQSLVHKCVNQSSRPGKVAHTTDSRDDDVNGKREARRRVRRPRLALRRLHVTCRCAGCMSRQSQEPRQGQAAVNRGPRGAVDTSWDHTWMRGGWSEPMPTAHFHRRQVHCPVLPCFARTFRSLEAKGSRGTFYYHKTKGSCGTLYSAWNGGFSRETFYSLTRSGPLPPPTLVPLTW